VALAGTGIAVAAGASSTVNRTIDDRDGDNRLEPAPGDPYVHRDDLGTTTAGRKGVPLVTFGQLTDFQLVDEESPARVEFLDKVGPPFTSAYRPMEGTGPQVVDRMVREMRNAVSPVTHRRVEAVMTTGDNTVNTQCNETRWVVDILDGEANGDPGSGQLRNCAPEGLQPTARRVDPNSGIEGSCATAPDRRLYDGVRGGGEYYEPDSSAPMPGADAEDGPGYSPDQAENEREAQRTNSVRDFPGLFERMNEPFLPTGFGDVPWYGIFGNHDGLVQGNQNRNAAIDAIAQGCVKVTGLPPAELQAILRLFRTDPRAANELLLDAIARVVLDSVADAGGDRGNLDETQFRWLDDQLTAADTAGELTFAFAHHTLETMNQEQPSAFPAGDNPPPPYEPVHFGEASRQQPCPVPAAPAAPPETLKCLFLRHPTVVGYVVGHEHNNRVRPVPRSGVDGDEASGRAAGGFWQVVTAAHIDWPQQSRLLDLVDNSDGTLSIWGTILDHAAPPNPGNGGGSSVTPIASISRELAFNDPDADNGEDGRPDARGGAEDRNVELVVRDPRWEPVRRARVPGAGPATGRRAARRPPARLRPGRAG